MEMCVDEAYLLALVEDEPFPISDEKFASELSLQEALYSQSQLILSTNTNTHHIIHQYSETSFSENNTVVITAKGESSQSKLIFCGICMETKEHPEIFNGLTQCNDHLFCLDCMGTYIASKINGNIATVECPDPNCKGVIKPENCSSILPKEVFGRWENALCESLVLGYQKFYCPFKDCSVLLIDDEGCKVTQSECPSCHRMFCASCRVGWHEGVTCEEFQKLGKNEREKEDMMLMKLAKEKNWRRCCKCKYYVEKTEGCLHMTCRCGYEFCYRCGEQWGNTHGGC